MLGKKREIKEEETQYKSSSSSSSFLITLYRILNGNDNDNDNENSKYIQWSQDGKSIIISNKNDFAKEVLPKHYKTDNYHSFVKQLNSYGFRKKQTGNKDEACYINEQFNKNKSEDEIRKIKIKKK